MQPQTAKKIGGAGTSGFRSITATQCPLWVISGHLQCKTSCLLYPQKRTCAVALGHVCFVPEADSCTATNPVQTRHRQMQAAEGLAVQFGGIHPVVGQREYMLTPAAHVRGGAAAP